MFPCFVLFLFVLLSNLRFSFVSLFFPSFIICSLLSLLFVTSKRSFCLPFFFTYLILCKLTTSIYILFLFVSLCSCSTNLELMKFKNVFSVVVNYTGQNCSEPFSPLPIHFYGFMRKFKLTFILICSLILLQCQYQRMNLVRIVGVLYGFSLCTSSLTFPAPDNL